MAEKVVINMSAREKNDRIALQNRERLSHKRVINMIGSPGAGKTAILERTARALGNRLAVIEGDIKTELDAQRIISHGSQAIQIETGGGCHLNAQMVSDALNSLNLDSVDIIIIENVGNLVCPSGFDIGEDVKVAVLSLPEGDEKPVKYPNLFLNSAAVLINKIDLRDVLDYDIQRVKTDCHSLNSSLRIMEISAKTGEGFDAWLSFVTDVG